MPLLFVFTKRYVHFYVVHLSRIVRPLKKAM